MSSSLRRSARASTPTLRGRALMDQRNGNSRFPSVGDDIKVKWIIETRSVWWPATAVSLQSDIPNEGEICGEILYQKLGKYSAVQVSVVFSSPSADERFVTSADKVSKKKDAEASTWLFFDQSTSSDDDAVKKEEEEDPQPDSCGVERRVARSKNRRHQRSATRSLAVRSIGIDRRRHSSVPASSVLNKRSSRKTHTNSQPRDDEVKDEAAMGVLSTVVTGAKDANEGSNEAGGQGHNEIVTGSNVTQRDRGEVDIQLRLRLIERQLQEVGNRNMHSMSSTMYSVLVSLRWAFLKALEKPLKPFTDSSQAKTGISQHQVSINVQCDYNTFREMSAVLAKEYRCVPEEPNLSRVAFSPSFHTTQSGSTASTDMSVIFSSLSDLTSFLRIRDDNDFEAILSKEVLSSTSTLLRILGSLKLSSHADNEPQRRQENTALTSTTLSVSASSEQSQFVHVYVGTAPISSSSSRSRAEHKIFSSTVFTQECKHFCSVQKCFRTPWTLKQIESPHLVDCSFHLDGAVSAEEMKNYFTLKWKQQVAPSSSKWTRDVQDVGSNPPGVLHLSVPAICVSTSRNVHSLVSLLDNHIETFMRVRSSMHSSSSFK